MPDTLDPQGSEPKPHLLDEVRARIRTLHYSLRTEQTYVAWIRRFILFRGKPHPLDMGEPEVETFLPSLVVEREVSASTQKQALAAILFLYKEMLEMGLPWLDGITRARRRIRVPVVLKPAETTRLLSATESTHALMAQLLYGSGIDGVSALAGEKRGFRTLRGDGARGQGRQGQADDVAAAPFGAFARASCAGADAA